MVSTGSGMVAGSRVIALMVCSFMSRVPVLSTTFGGAASVRVYETVRPLPEVGDEDRRVPGHTPADRQITNLTLRLVAPVLAFAEVPGRVECEESGVATPDP